MASNVPTPAPGKIEWLIVVPDKPGAQAKRLEVRPLHFEGLKRFTESGTIKTGGALFNSKPESDDPNTFDFYGSTLVAEAATREEILDILKQDIYTTSGVWDLDKVQIWPAKIAFRNV